VPNEPLTIGPATRYSVYQLGRHCPRQELPAPCRRPTRMGAVASRHLTPQRANVKPPIRRVSSYVGPAARGGRHPAVCSFETLGRDPSDSMKP